MTLNHLILWSHDSLWNLLGHWTLMFFVNFLLYYVVLYCAVLLPGQIKIIINCRLYVNCMLPRENLLMQPSGQSTRAPYAVERDAHSGPGSNFKPQPRPKRIISNNSDANDEQEKSRFDGVLYKLRPLPTPWSSSVRLLAALAWLK